MSPMQPVPLPYDLTHDALVITDEAPEDLVWQSELMWIVKNCINNAPDGVERILRSTTLLMNRPDNVDSLDRCLHQAIVWECG